MSTRVFNGYRLPADTDIAALARDLRARTEPVYQDLALRAVAAAALLLAADGEREKVNADAVEIIGFGQIKSDAIKHLSRYNLFGQAAGLVDAVQEVLASRTARHVPFVFDLAFNVVFVSDPAPTDTDGNFTYALLYTDRDDFKAVWESTPGVQEMAYWDNSDPDEGMTEAEWDRRGTAWARILGYDAPGHIGLTWEHRPAFRLSDEAMLSNGDREAPHDWLTIDRALDWLVASTATDDALFTENRPGFAEKFASKDNGLNAAGLPIAGIS